MTRMRGRTAAHSALTLTLMIGRAMVAATFRGHQMKADLCWRTLSRSAFLLLAATLASAGCQGKGGPLKVDRVEPDQGITAGGDLVTIYGSGFEPGKTGVEVRFGRARAEQVGIAAGNKITVVTPAGDKGPVDVTLMFDNGAQFKIPSGFKFIVPSTQDVRRAYFTGKPGEKKPAAGTNTNTTPPAK